jgi:hypothetical protein
LSVYYQVLAEGLLQMRGRKYFEFHRDWLAYLGMPLSPWRLFRGFCGALLSGLAHPIKAVKSISRRWPLAWQRQKDK